MAEAGLEREVIDILSLIEKKQNFLLSGGAGSGKTYSLVSLLKKVSEKYPKVRIACITYTNAAALEIRDRCHIGNLYVSRRPFSTQHKVKGLEYENVLVILDSSGWNKYNFDYVLDDSIYDSLPKGKKESYKRIKRRTEKLLYVCCTRAKENLVLYYPDPSNGVVQGMERLIGKDNCVNLELV